MKTLNYLMDHILDFQEIQDYFKSIITKQLVLIFTNNTPIQEYINKIKNRITLKINIGYIFELSTHQTIKLLGSKEEKQIKRQKW